MKCDTSQVNGFLKDCPHGNCIGCECLCHYTETKLKIRLGKIMTILNEYSQIDMCEVGKTMLGDLRGVFEDN